MVVTAAESRQRLLVDDLQLLPRQPWLLRQDGRTQTWYHGGRPIKLLLHEEPDSTTLPGVLTRDTESQSMVSVSCPLRLWKPGWSGNTGNRCQRRLRAAARNLRSDGVPIACLAPSDGARQLDTQLIQTSPPQTHVSKFGV